MEEQYQWSSHLVELANTLNPFEPWNWADPDSVDHMLVQTIRDSGPPMATELNKKFLELDPISNCQTFTKT